MESLVKAQRKEWRQLLLTTREQLRQQSQWFERASQSIHEQLRAILAQRKPRCVGAYAPIRGEFDPLPVMTEWLQQAGQAALPEILPTSKTVQFLRWTPGCAMRIAEKGIPTPDTDEVLHPDLLLVPCVGWGTGNIRLGYGGGYYDRTLGAMTTKPYLVGISFKFGFIPELKAEPHDIAMNEIVTDAAKR